MSKIQNSNKQLSEIYSKIRATKAKQAGALALALFPILGSFVIFAGSMGYCAYADGKIEKAEVQEQTLLEAMHKDPGFVQTKTADLAVLEQQYADGLVSKNYYTQGKSFINSEDYAVEYARLMGSDDYHGWKDAQKVQEDYLFNKVAAMLGFTQIGTMSIIFQMWLYSKGWVKDRVIEFKKAGIEVKTLQSLADFKEEMLKIENNENQKQ